MPTLVYYSNVLTDFVPNATQREIDEMVASHYTWLVMLHHGNHEYETLKDTRKPAQSEPPEFPYGEFDDGKHWKGE